MHTDYFHRICGTYLFTRAGPRYHSWEVVTGFDVLLADGTLPLPCTALRCGNCRCSVPFCNSVFRIHERRD